MSSRWQSFRAADRGASETAGAALLIGLVAFATLATLVIGGSAIDGVQSQTNERQASTILQEMDSRFSSLSARSDSPEMSFDLGDTNPDDFAVEQSGSVNVTVNRNSVCSSNITMSSMRYENNEGAVIGYEAGGVWRRGPAGGSSMVTSPSITFNEGTIDIHVVNLTGNVDQAKNRAEFLEAKSRADSTKYSSRLFQAGCVRPNNVTMKVKSDFYVAWGDYLETEFDGTVTTFDSNQTARVYLSQTNLPERVDDTKNNVVNLSSSSGYSPTTISTAPGSITVDKSANNVYSVSVTPLNAGGLNIGNVTNIDDATNITRPPLDVMFVMDESGSMGNTDGDGVTRAEEAQDAAQGFLSELNDSMDRAGLVSFDNDGEYRITHGGSGYYITSDFDALNTTIETVGSSGGTRSQTGMEYANNVFELRSNSTRDRVMVLLTDGVNNDCQEGPSNSPMDPETNNADPDDCDASYYSDNKQSLRRTADAAANGVTIYTIGYGDDSYIDEGFLEAVATRTGGKYYQATSSSQLDAVFDDIVKEIAQTKNIALSPVSANYTSGGGNVYSPQAAGSTDHVERFNVGGNDFANINDPTAGSQFTYSFAISDGESVEISAYDFDCQDWAGTGSTRTHAGDIYNVVRCTNITTAGTLDPTAIYTDGEKIDHILNEDEAWWQEDINETFNAHSEISVNRTAGANFGRLDLESNQALVYWDLPDGPDSENRLLMLYEIGLSESDADVSGIINLEVSSIDLG